MNDSELQAQIAAAATYEDLFVPALFRQWVPRVVNAAQIQPGDRVLDVACGTGVLAREAASHVGSSGFVAGLDLNPGMLEVAARLAPDIEWRQGTAESIPYTEILLANLQQEPFPRGVLRQLRSSRVCCTDRKWQWVAWAV